MFTVTVNEVTLTFETHPSLFSPRSTDKGTRAMLSTADEHLAALQAEGSPVKVLDLGCGYGLAGIYLAKKYPGAVVHMSDIDPVAVSCAEANLTRNGFAADDTTTPRVYVSDGFASINETGYAMILCNPPYHTDFSVAKHLIEKSFNRLCIGGRLFFVTKRREWYKQKFIAVFGGVRITEQDGYFVFMGTKTRTSRST